MKVKDIIDVDTVNYKKISMFIATSKCDFKCDRECGEPVCQNSELAKAPTIEINNEEIIRRYIANPITEAIVFGGLEPFDSFDELCYFLGDFENYYKGGHIHIKEKRPDIVIYTGYYPEEIKTKLHWIKKNKTDKQINIIIKFGRFIPDRPHRYDELLGIELSSDNQFAKRLEDC